ncbi:hypothetical protein PanWU01x14_138510 [Parasponia andersonii]|uniref:Uncharacterized protein n=1 Tax=Parasponia andersonii TaxID=3476 RepID=A0A2P5CMV5_PARAD|nr:hypothetical protein PanWU01x14_138510 [Parasponia andersonii]
MEARDSSSSSSWWRIGMGPLHYCSNSERHQRWWKTTPFCPSPPCTSSPRSSFVVFKLLLTHFAFEALIMTISPLSPPYPFNVSVQE